MRSFSEWYKERVIVHLGLDRPCIVNTMITFEIFLMWAGPYKSFDEFVFGSRSIDDWDQTKRLITKEDFDMAKYYLANLACIK
jgi:hypothetical protein